MKILNKILCLKNYKKKVFLMIMRHCNLINKTNKIFNIRVGILRWWIKKINNLINKIYNNKIINNKIFNSKIKRLK